MQQLLSVRALALLCLGQCCKAAAARTCSEHEPCTRETETMSQARGEGPITCCLQRLHGEGVPREESCKREKKEGGEFRRHHGCSQPQDGDSTVGMQRKEGLQWQHCASCLKPRPCWIWLGFSLGCSETRFRLRPSWHCLPQGVRMAKERLVGCWPSNTGRIQEQGSREQEVAMYQGSLSQPLRCWELLCWGWGGLWTGLLGKSGETETLCLQRLSYQGFLSQQGSGSRQ